MSKITLILGGARSGKSTYAEQRCLPNGRLKKRYIATAQIWDEETRERVNKHKDRRAQNWDVTEEVFKDLSQHLLKTEQPSQITLVDCLTLWLTNEMLSNEKEDINPVIDTFVENIAKLKQPYVFVSNEVGMGIVPENALARKFRDAQGRLNQKVAKVANQVIFVAAGLPLKLK